MVGQRHPLNLAESPHFLLQVQFNRMGSEFSNGLHMLGKQFGPHQDFGGVYNSFGSHGYSLPDRPNSNHVEVAPSCGFGCELGLSGVGAYNESGSSVSWRTKPRAQVYTGSDPCNGLPRILDLHASNVSNSTGSNVHAT